MKELSGSHSLSHHNHHYISARRSWKMSKTIPDTIMNSPLQQENLHFHGRVLVTWINQLLHICLTILLCLHQTRPRASSGSTSQLKRRCTPEGWAGAGGSWSFMLLSSQRWCNPQLRSMITINGFSCLLTVGNLEDPPPPHWESCYVLVKTICLLHLSVHLIIQRSEPNI